MENGKRIDPLKDYPMHVVLPVLDIFPFIKIHLCINNYEIFKLELEPMNSFFLRVSKMFHRSMTRLD